MNKKPESKDTKTRRPKAQTKPARPAKNPPARKAAAATKKAPTKKAAKAVRASTALGVSEKGAWTKYTPTILAKAQAYADGGYERAGDVIPSVVGLALALGVTKQTVYNWVAEHEAFAWIVEHVDMAQERRLISHGLMDLFNPVITKMLLVRHGYSDKTLNEVTGANGGALAVESTVTFVLPPPMQEDE